MDNDKVSSILNKFYQELETKKNDRAKAIGIFCDGKLMEELLDEKPYNHGTAFNYIAYSSGLKMTEDNHPIIAGQNLADQNVLAMQIRDNICVVYFPDVITSIQYDVFLRSLANYNDMEFQFNKSPQLEGYLTKSDVLEYASSIIVKYINRER